MVHKNLVRMLALLMAFAMVAAACAPDDEPAEEPEPGEEEPAEDPADDEPADDEPADDEPADEEPADDEPADDETAAEPGQTGVDLIVGTTDTVVSVDPAAVYDYYSSNILFNVGETLVAFAPGETEVSPLLAEDLPDISEDGLTYTFTLQEGVTFHNGKELDSEDVAFSLERAVNMNHPQGAGFLLDGIQSIETPDERTVEITLEEPNITFLSRLAYTVATILPSDGTYPAPDTEVEDEGAAEEGEPVAADEYVHEDLVATGPYLLDDFREGQSITLVANPDYWGDAPQNDRVLVQFYETSSQMKLALERGEIDVAYRDLSPEERADIETVEGVQTVEGDGAFIRYIVLNVHHEPFDDPDVRRAIAAAVDRQRIIDDVFEGGGEPLYSMIPTGFEPSEPFFQEYEQQDPSDFIDETISFDLWYGGERYGPTEPSLAQVIQRSLEETGLFEVELHSSEWAQFTAEAWPGPDGQYPAFLLGWYPSYFDPDYYVEPFYHSGGFLGMYEDPEMDELVAAQQQVDDPAGAERYEVFSDIQRKAMEDAPIIPLFQDVPFVFAQDNVTGLEDTMDVIQIFRYWMVSKDE